MGRFARSKWIARIVRMNELTIIIACFWGLDYAWLVKSVDPSMEAKGGVIVFDYQGGRLICPDCGEPCT